MDIITLTARIVFTAFGTTGVVDAPMYFRDDETVDMHRTIHKAARAWGQSHYRRVTVRGRECRNGNWGVLMDDEFNVIGRWTLGEGNWNC